jgi:hypothetical protein
MSLRRSLLGACVAALAIAAPAQADIINTTYSVDDSTNNCLTGEAINFVQTYHVVAKFDGTPLEDGSNLVWSRFDPLTADGVGAESGDHYVIQTKTKLGDGTSPSTSVVQFHVLDTGTGADFLVTTLVHTTYNANGELTVEHEAGNFRCGDDHLHVGVQL